MEADVTRRSIYILAAALVAGLAASPLAAQDRQQQTTSEGKPGVVISKLGVLRATVTDVDKANRLVTLRTDDGREETIKCGPEVRNFDQIEKGDKVAAEYYEATVIFARKPEAAAGAASGAAQPTAATASKAELAPLGAKPGGIITDVTEVTATVQDIDYAKRQMTLRGPRGNAKVVNIADDVPNIESVKKGDEIVLRHTEALAISVTK
jgi:arginine repressor